MKILYIWIMCSENKFIQKQGFNIAGEYEFNFNFETGQLNYINKTGYIKNFWNDSNNIITDLSVIVGSNGAGKSTLLSEIIKYGLVMPKEMHGQAKSKAESFRELVGKKLVVYEEEDKLYYDHNLDMDMKCKRNIVRKRFEPLKVCTKIFVSNSIKNPVTTAMYQGYKVIDYALTDSTIADQAFEGAEWMLCCR